MLKITVLGFGEAAQAFVAGWRTQSPEVAATPISTYDIKVEDELQRPQLIEASARLDVYCAVSPGEALSGSAAVFSLVTADRVLEAAEHAATGIRPGTFYFDCNSCAPSTKTAAAALIDSAGGTYVDVAVMAPVYPARHRTPLLVAGRDAVQAVEYLSALGMNAKAAGSEIGQASSIKMLRSVMIKGFEALTAECMLAARRAGVESAVLASLQASDPGIDWEKRSSYNLERMLVHGSRRAAEMEEVAVTLRDLGLPDRMTLAAVGWQRQLADLSLDAAENSLSQRADRILTRLVP